MVGSVIKLTSLINDTEWNGTESNIYKSKSLLPCKVMFVVELRKRYNFKHEPHKQEQR